MDLLALEVCTGRDQTLPTRVEAVSSGLVPAARPAPYIGPVG